MICSSLVLTNQTPSLSQVLPSSICYQQSSAQPHSYYGPADSSCNISIWFSQIFGYTFPYLSSLTGLHEVSPGAQHNYICHHSDHNHTNDSLAFMSCLNHFSNVLGIGLPRTSGGSPIVVPPLVHFCSGLMAHLQPLHTSHHCDMLATSTEVLELLTHL